MSGSGSHGPRVAIPRLQRTNQMQNLSQRDSRRRVARACTACHSHKIKCSGDRPQCKHCDSSGRECIYNMPRKDRLKIVTERCVQMASLLKTLRGQANEVEAGKIGDLLNAVEEDLSDIPVATSPLPEIEADEPRDLRNLFDGRIVDPREKVDTSSLDLLDENLHENDRSRATGFVGKNSEVQWLRSLVQKERSEDNASSSKELFVERRGSTATSAKTEQVSQVTFYLDNANIDPDFYVEPYGLPAPETAEHLLAVYMEKVHDFFPILPRKLFEDQCHRYFEALRHGTLIRPNPKWQAIVQLVFAIASRYSHLSKASWRADPRDHLIYQARARSFGWNEATLTQHPDLPQIQVAGLLSFYYLSVGQVSRAWVVAGMALRFAQALGLHVRNEDPSTSAPKREVLVRTWWSLYSLDRHLSVITGRPSIIVDGSCSVPLPMPLAEEQITDNTAGMRWGGRSGSAPDNSPGGANSGSCIRAVAQMGIITKSILSGLYSAGTMVRTPVAIQQDIIELGRRLDGWVVSLPAEFDFNNAQPHAPQAFSRERILLGFEFHSARILLTRPCLGGLGHPGKDAGEASFLRQMAMICVGAAKAELDMLPDKPDPLFLFETGPWWCIVHYLMQALAAILLALSYSSLGSQYDKSLAEYTKKGIRWLRSMDDPLAERAYRVAFMSLEMVAKKRSLDTTDLWSEHALASSTLTLDPDETLGLDRSFPTTQRGGGVYPMPNLYDSFQGDPMSSGLTFPFQAEFPHFDPHNLMSNE